jgi:hypothetical protein
MIVLGGAFVSIEGFMSGWYGKHAQVFKVQLCLLAGC